MSGWSLAICQEKEHSTVRRWVAGFGVLTQQIGTWMFLCIGLVLHPFRLKICVKHRWFNLFPSIIEPPMLSPQMKIKPLEEIFHCLKTKQNQTALLCLACGHSFLLKAGVGNPRCSPRTSGVISRLSKSNALLFFIEVSVNYRDLDREKQSPLFCSVLQRRSLTELENSLPGWICRVEMA